MKTLLDYLKEQLVEGLTIKEVKETNSKYTVCFEYDGGEAKADLPKSCAPGYHREVCDTAIITAVSSIYFCRGNYKVAKMWLDKITEKHGGTNND